jgi:cytochrome c peroxidase
MHFDQMKRQAADAEADNMNTKRVGRLGLSDAEEDALVSSMQTLTDGFMSRGQP